MDSFTCNTCGLQFKEADFQRDHMRTDWHRYNLKRRVAGLPPIPSEIFAEKMLEQRKSEAQASSGAGSNRQVTKKDLKRQEKERRRLEKAGNSRASSMTSAMSEFSLGEPTPADSYDSEEEEEKAINEKLQNRVEIAPNVCFMDGHEASSVEDNVAYLERKYGLVIPEPQYVTDLAALLTYINEKVGLGNCCLSCTYMGRSLEAVRAHMLDKQHIKIPYDTEAQKEELEDFYDFSSSYQNDNDGWEDTDEEEVSGDEIITEEDIVDGNQIYSDGYELQLAPGVTAGHRSLAKYYKQRHSFQPKEREGARAVKMIDVRSPGVTEKAAEKMVKQQWKQTKRAEHSKFKHDKHINFQKHFRDELLQ